MRASPVLRKFAVSKVVALSLAATLFSALTLGCNDGGNPSKPAAYRLTTTAFPAGSGTVSRSPDEPDYRAGTRVTVTAEPAEGYEFAGWSGASEATTPSVSVTMNSDLTLTAIFQAVTAESFVIMTNTAPEDGGSVSMNPDRTNYTVGTLVTVTAEPASGYEFDYWTVTGGTIADIDNAEVQITLSANIVMTANFREVVIRGVPDTRWYTSDTLAPTYTIYTEDELAGLSELARGGNDFAGRTIILGDDIDLMPYGVLNTGFNNGRGWIPIGAFSGTLDGNSKVISGLSINATSGSSHGLFGKIEGGTVKNLGIVDGEINARYAIGALAATLSGGSVENCYSTIDVTGNDEQVGGLLGAANSGAIVSNSYTTGRIRGTQYVGGLVGYAAASTITSSYATGAITGTSFVGGLLGYMTSMNVINSAALNSNIQAPRAGRVHGMTTSSPPPTTNTAGFAGMKQNDLETEWSETGANGTHITLDEIHADGTIGNRFREDYGWTVEDGKLPGLMGRAVDLPAHLR